MIRIERYTSIDKVALRQKGWMWFGVVIGLQVLFLSLSYILNV